MNEYKLALFDAFVWPQAVEEQVRYLVYMFDDAGRLKLSKKDRSKVEKATFGFLIKMLQPCLSEDLCKRLEWLKDERNNVVHRSSYVTNILSWNAEPNGFESEVADEIKRFKKIKTCAGDILGELTELRGEL